MPVAEQTPVKASIPVNTHKPAPGERRAIPKNDPAKVNEMLSVAKTYYDARFRSGQPIFTYGHITAVDDDFFSLNVRNQIDCSAYIGLMLRGVNFKDSPYYHLVSPDAPDNRLMGRELIRDIQNKIKVNTKYSWAFDPYNFKYRKKLSDPTKYPARTASQLGEMFVEMGRSLDFKPDFSDVEPGDIIFYAKKTNGTFKQPNRYKKISHISVVVSKEPSGKNSDAAQTGYPYNHMMLEVSSKNEVVLNRSLEKISPETVCLIARPDMSGKITKNTEFNSFLIRFIFDIFGKLFGKK